MLTFLVFLYGLGSRFNLLEDFMERDRKIEKTSREIEYSDLYSVGQSIK